MTQSIQPAEWSQTVNVRAIFVYIYSLIFVVEKHIQKISKYIYVFSALKIHVSSATKEVLDKFNTFELECRGEVDMKVNILKKESSRF